MNMNNAEIIKGIDMTIAGLETIKNALANEETSAPAPKATKSVAKAEKKSEAPASSAEGEYTREELENMKYNDLKKYGASLGVKCVGTRDEIIDKILAVGGAPAEAEDDGEDDEPKSKAKTPAKSAPANKKLGKKSEPDEPAEDDGEDEFEAQAKEVAEENSAEDIIESLAEVGVKANKKNYVEKLADALRKGLIDLSDDEGDDEAGDESGEDDGAEAVDFDAETYFEEFDPEGFNNPENMNEERAEAVKVLMESILSDIDSGEISAEDIASYIDDNANDDEKELITDEEDDAQVIGLYCELRKRMIDDEGEEHEPSDPYEVNGEFFCCGHKLKYSKKNKKYICETCGEEYEQ